VKRAFVELIMFFLSLENVLYMLLLFNIDGVVMKHVVIVFKTIATVSIITLKVLITRAPVKECSVFRMKRCTSTVLPQSVLKIVYISICVKIINKLLQLKQSDLFSLHFMSNNMCWRYLFI